MFKKSIVGVVTTAFLMAGPGHLTLDAAAQTVARGAVTGVTVTPALGNGLGSPIAAPSFNSAPSLMPGALDSSLLAPSLAAPALSGPSSVGPVQAAMPAALAPTLPAAAKPAFAAPSKGDPMAIIGSHDASVGVAEKAAALDEVFDNSIRTGHESLEVMGQYAPSIENGLSRSEVPAAKSPAAVEKAKASGSVLVTAGVVAAVVAVVAAVSKPFRAILARGWNALLGVFGLGVKKMETPQVMAQRIIDELNAQKPVYNQKVADASTLVEKLKLQVAAEEKKVADAERDITALLSDSDPTNDILATGLINQQKTLNASIALTKEQVVLAEKTLEGIKESRASFFAEREEMLAKIQAGLTKAAAADIQKQIAVLKGGFQVGDLKDNMDKFEDAVNDRVADAKGHQDSADTNPDQVLKKAKDALKSQEVQDEIAKRKAAIEAAKKDNGAGSGLLLELGVGAAVVAVAALISRPFRNILARAWNALLGVFGMGVKRMETPEVMAQRIVDELNAQKPVYNRKVQEASTLVEKLRLQIEKQSAESADLDRSVTAILSDSDPLNDVMAETLLNQKKTVDASTAMTQEQLVLSEKTLADIKDERVRFFSEREEMLAKINAGLTKAKAADIQKQIAVLKGGFQVGDLKDNMDKFEDAVNDRVADAKGHQDSEESNPDQILKKAKDSLKNAEVQDEIARRKAAIEAAKKDKGRAGGDASQSKALGMFAKVIGIGFALISPWISSAVFALLGLVSIAMAPEQGRWFGRQLAVIGIGTLLVGGVASVLVAKLGLALGAFGVGISFAVPGGIALAAGIIAALRARSKANGAVAAASATPAGSSVLTPAPVVSAPAETSAPAASSPKVKFSLKPLFDLMARAWNALLGIFGLGVKKLETPEIMAQRLIDQLNAAKPVYNQKVAEASTLVEKLRAQIAGEAAKIADFDRTITALLSDSDPSNDIQAAGLINSQKTLETSIALSKEQLAAAESGLEGIKQERARFFAEREEALAKIQSGLTKAAAADIQKEIAKLKGGFEVGDLKDNMDRFDDAVAGKVADAKGHQDSADANPDQVLKKAKDSLRTQEIADELARRKAAIEEAKKDRGGAAGKLGSYPVHVYILGAAGFGTTLLGPVVAVTIVAVLGTLTLLDNLTAAGHLDKSSKFYALSIGIGAGALATLGLSGLGWPFYIAAWAAVLAGGVGKLHKALHREKTSGRSDKGAGSGLLLELGVGAAVVAAAALISRPFRNILARAWNALLGAFGMGVKKMETPEVMAQRIIDELNAQKPVYNRKVQEASTLVEKLRLQIEKQTAQSADLDRSVTAILSDSDPLNDVMAETLLNQKKTVDASTAMTQEQLTLSEKTLADIKEERVRFFSEREEMLAKINAGLTKAKAADIQKQIAVLKGGFQVGDLKDNMDKFEDAVNDRVADAKGHQDSAESNPDQILKKAKDSLKNAEVQDEIARRKAAIEAAKKDKGRAGGAVDESVSMTAAQAEPKLLSKTYSWMTLGLGITAAAAQAAIVTGLATTALASLPVMIGLAVLQLALVIGLSLGIRRLSPGAALSGFLLYSGVNGLFLAPLVAMFTVGSVAAAFLVTAGMFGTMAFIGHTTKKNLNSVGSYGMMALVGVILASLANMFIGSTGLAAILTYATVLVFVGLTAYDAQKIKEMAQQEGRLDKDDVSRIAVMGALTLYLDFINLFIQMLKIMGKAKSK